MEDWQRQENLIISSSPYQTLVRSKGVAFQSPVRFHTGWLLQLNQGNQNQKSEAGFALGHAMGIRVPLAAI